MKKRSSAERLFARYKTYTGAPGNPEEWRAAAAALVDPLLVDHLAALGLARVPATQADLKQARRDAIRDVHPDRGGDAVRAAAINAAFDQVARMIAKPAAPAGAPSSLLITPPRCTASLPEIISADGAPTRHAFTAAHVGEVKLNGEREMLYIGFDPLGRRHGTTMLSRQKSKADGLFGDKTDLVPHVTGTDIGALDQTVLDGEIFNGTWSATRSVMGAAPGGGAGMPTFYVFDIPFLKGRDLRQLPYRDRRAILLEVIAELGNPWIVAIPQIPFDQIDDEFRRITDAGGEGLVVKDIEGTYGQGWAKYKKASDVSAFIIGYVEGKRALEGLVGSIELGVLDASGAVIAIGAAGGFTNAQRLEITANRDAWLGRVVDVFAFELTAARRLLNATFHRYRDDIDRADCTLDKVRADLKTIKGNRRRK